MSNGIFFLRLILWGGGTIVCAVMFMATIIVKVRG